MSSQAPEKYKSTSRLPPQSLTEVSHTLHTKKTSNNAYIPTNTSCMQLNYEKSSKMKETRLLPTTQSDLLKDATRQTCLSKYSDASAGLPHASWSQTEPYSTLTQILDTASPRIRSRSRLSVQKTVYSEPCTELSWGRLLAYARQGHVNHMKISWKPTSKATCPLCERWQVISACSQGCWRGA